MDNILKSISKYVLSALLIIFGMIFLFKYTGAKGLAVQDKGMLAGALLMIIVGIIALPFIAEKITKTMRTVLTIVAAIGVILVGYGVVNSLTTEIDFINDQNTYNNNVIQDLKDIREAQTAFKKIHGRFTANVNGELIDFINAKVIPVPGGDGMFIEAPSNSDPNLEPTDDEIGVGNGSEQTYRDKGFVIKYADLDSIAKDLGTTENELLILIKENRSNYKIKDTTYVSLWDQRFADKIREKKKLPPVDLSTMSKNPNNLPYLVEVGEIEERSGGNVAKMSTICVKDPTPFGRPNVKRDTLQFGSTYEAHTDGSWRRIQE